MKVKCIKYTIGFQKWKVYETETQYIAEYHCWPVKEYVKYPEYFQEVVDQSPETPKPRWKVGDYVVVNWCYIKIYSIL
jgi:hypothetical protein